MQVHLIFRWAYMSDGTFSHTSAYFFYTNISGVSVSRKAHGPAVTVTIQQPRRHNINVDIVPCIPSNLPVTSNCWPRPDTRKALSDLQIKNIMDVGTHLVPKGDIVFNVSYSKAEKELLKSLDAGNGCRKQCHQVMKRLVQEFASKSPDGAPGISSHLFKVNEYAWYSTFTSLQERQLLSLHVCFLIQEFDLEHGYAVLSL